MIVLAAPNAFKNALTAEAATHAIERGILAADPSYVCIPHPIADGGDGTGELLITQLHATCIEGMATGPMGQPVPASFGWLEHDRTAIIDMSTASGIRLLQQEQLNPCLATSFGTGELIRHALDMGAQRILLGMGGSATVDGGMGILSALGAQFLDEAGVALQTPGELERLSHIDLSHWDVRIEAAQISILCDVHNPLLGPEGAAAIFGPQKGATPQMVQTLEAGLSRMRTAAMALTGRDMSDVSHAGTAGGAAAGLYALAGAMPVNGIEHFLDITAFDVRLARCDIVVTGEGSLDAQTVHGKGPFGVALRAKKMGKPVIGLAGRIDDSQGILAPYFDLLHNINPIPTDLPTALQHTAQNLEAAMLSILNTFRP